MKNNKIDFFSSPNPRHFILNNIQINRFHPEDNEIVEERLFNTPIHHFTHANQSPVINIDPYFSCSHKRQKRKSLGDFHVEQQSIENEESSDSQMMGIEQKIEFSQEMQQQQLLVTITPKKPTKIQQDSENQNLTIKRKAQLLQCTPITQSKTYERGLKKLAYQAFRFVFSQKRTTYKEVARKLISQLSNEQDIDIQKKGQMNIKRRVYDALNVLIALGLLKRNGNKIQSKKTDFLHSVGFDKIGERDIPELKAKKDELLFNQLENLRKSHEKRDTNITEKSIMLKRMSQKIEKLKLLRQRNVKMRENHSSSNRIELPLIIICQTECNMKGQPQKQESICINHDDNGNFQCSFNQSRKIQVMGDLDVLKNLNIGKTAEPITQSRPRRQLSIRRNRLK